MVRQKQRFTGRSEVTACAIDPKTEHRFIVILSFLGLFLTAFAMSCGSSKANPFVSSTTPGMIMAKIEFALNSPENDNLLTAKQIRLQVMNSGGEELIYVKTAADRFNPKAGFSHGKKDRYQRPEDYPKNREPIIASEPVTYKQALARYMRAISLYKKAASYRAKQRALVHLTHCHNRATELYKKEVAALKSAK